MPKHKSFINRKNATTFALVERSQQDKFAGDANAPQHVLKDISRKKEQQKYGIYFEDDYDYMQHMRCRNDDMSDAGRESSFTDQYEVNQKFDFEDEKFEGALGAALKDESVEGDEEEAKSGGATGFHLHEQLLGFDDPIYEGRVIENENEIDPDLLEAMKRAEEDMEVDADDAEEGELPDDFVQLASCARPEDEEMDDYDAPSQNKKAILNHFFDSLGGDAVRGLANFADLSDEDDEEPQVLRDLRESRERAEKEGRGGDYHSQCLTLQMEKNVEHYAKYDYDEVRSRVSGMTGALSESVRQAIETDKRDALGSVIYNPESTMTSEERQDHNDRTLALINEDSEKEEEEDPVQTWVDFDRRPRLDETVDTPRDGYEPLDKVMAACVIHPSSITVPGRKKRTSQSQKESETVVDSSDLPSVPLGPRDKKETAEERRQRKAAVKELQRQRRATKKENKLSFKTEKAHQKSMASGAASVGLNPSAPVVRL